MVQNVLITGINGFCARHITARLKAEGKFNVTGIGIRPSLQTGVQVNDYIAVDICDFRKLNDVICKIKPEIVFHLAGLTIGCPVDIYRVQLMGSINLLESLREFSPCARILMVGSAAEYGYVKPEHMPIEETHVCNPHGPYGVSKYFSTLASMDYARSYCMKIVIARPFNIIGAGVSASLVVGAILLRIKKILTNDSEPIITIGNLYTERDFIAVEDVVDAYIKLVFSGHWGEIFNLCSGKPHTIRSIIEKLLSFSDKEIKVRVDPKLVRSNDVKSVYGSWEKANRAIDFKPKIDINIALEHAWNYMINNKEIA